MRLDRGGEYTPNAIKNKSMANICLDRGGEYSPINTQ